MLTGTGVFTGNGGPVNTINSSVFGGGIFETPSINDSDDVAYARQSTGTAAIHVYSDGTSQPFVISSSSGPFFGLNSPHINAAGDIAFQGFVYQPTEGWGIYAGPDAVADRVIRKGDPLFGSTVSDVSLSTGRRLNDRGEILFLYVLTNQVVGFSVARPVTLLGDYNRNGVVDAADCVVWRDNEGTTNSLPNDPIGGTIGTAHYDQWKAHFGQTAVSAATDGLLGRAVPEPVSITLCSLVLAALAWRRHRQV